MNIKVIKGDITQIQVDVIVNAANEGLMGGGGVDGAIHRVGGPSILAECLEIRRRQGGCPTGDAVMTTAGNLPALKVIHTVGPVWSGGLEQEESLLRSCYNTSLHLTEAHGFQSIAFPNISTGIYGYPKHLAAKVAFDSVSAYVSDSIQEVFFVCFDDDNHRLYKELLQLRL